MTRIVVNGMGLNVESAGQGLPLVLLHGFTGSTANWRSHLPALAACCRVIAIDMLGHGQSDAPSDPARYSLEHTAHDIVAILDYLNIEKAAVLGYSMGGRIALHFAINRPERLNGLILESASPGLASAEERAARVASDNALAERIEREGIEAFVDYWGNIPLFASQKALSEETRAALRAQRLQNRPAGLANSLRGAGTGMQAPLWQSLGELQQVPVLLLAGELDPKYCAVARQMQHQLAAAQLKIVPGAGHTIHLENPALFDRLVVDFLKRIQA
ncbi:MAG TPA: 2-succinyl-6-hydroxy-2,4-cyclohexadiene-1-carboxylate synthase [Chloroflexia bacterium]|nr:2-succinyl-6-hydroxy-2,4-cyclohexadiene-1-carboxylate synthase [Chloroflexia bacterium]